MRDHPKQDACLDSIGLVHRPIEFGLRSPHADDLSNGPSGLWGLVAVVDIGWGFFYFTRG